MTMTAMIQASKQKASRTSEEPSRHRDLNYYLGLNYPIELVKEDDQYIASHPDLPGCVSFGDNPTDAVENLCEVKTLWLKGQIEKGNAIPEPSPAGHYSGKFVLRIPKLLHQMADHRARQQGVSLNSYISAILAGALNFPFYSEHLRSHGMSIWLRETRHHWYCPDQNFIFEHGERSKGQEITGDLHLFIDKFARGIRTYSEEIYRAEEEKHFQLK